MFGFTCVPSCKLNKFRLGGGAIQTMFGFSCVSSCKPNKFRLSRVLSEQCSDLLAACVPTHPKSLPIIRTSFGLQGQSDILCKQIFCSTKRPSGTIACGLARFYCRWLLAQCMGTYWALCPNDQKE